ncbi:UDP-GalNAc:beta-1,3-N-acetylgalactosaminyltransferase 2-like [Patiria miniata]|uniref:UDP-GalNAc:beta-1,3-N-acetylgalactosaminyltransferase 2 n=1 Tax=Patiria miniata TaxID=46514 RepID=A0A913ZEA1_PATMI|nr:UDP-GalNAc:beta-1,3-N-acetylgalactosaminyltransferase 2-like [Patiria miniata]
MADLRIFSISLLCFLSASIIAWVYHNHDLYVLFRMPETEDKMSHEIVIGVLSARENTAQRQAIRDTWGQYIRDHSKLRGKMLARFIIGNRGCEIPHEFREDQYSCQSMLLKTKNVNLEKEMVAFDFQMPLSKNYGRRTSSGEYYGIDFKVNYAVIVKKLGVYAAGSLEQQCSVTLYDTWSQEPVISATFPPGDPSELQDGYRYRNVETYLFPKDFEGTIVVGPLSEDIQLSTISQNGRQIHNTHRILSIRSFLRTCKTATFPNEIGLFNLPFLPGNFIFEIYKPEEVEGMLNSSAALVQSQIEVNRQESQALKDEQQHHNDLLLVDAVDIYRNIPHKLLHFFHWVTSTTEANFIIKTDDDCFMNVNAIMEMIQDGQVAANSRTWWGNFRTNWPLDVLGKWAEHDYPSPVYPAFACGSGNLLTRDLVQWIAQNSQFLHTYQGEDVSMGIWLASILPTYLNDRRWQCDDECQEDALVLPEQSPQQLRVSWQNWIRCQNPCSCDWLNKHPRSCSE